MTQFAVAKPQQLTANDQMEATSNKTTAGMMAVIPRFQRAFQQNSLDPANMALGSQFIQANGVNQYPYQTDSANNNLIAFAMPQLMVGSAMEAMGVPANGSGGQHSYQDGVVYNRQPHFVAGPGGGEMLIDPYNQLGQTEGNDSAMFYGYSVMATNVQYVSDEIIQSLLHAALFGYKETATPVSIRLRKDGISVRACDMVNLANVTSNVNIAYKVIDTVYVDRFIPELLSLICYDMNSAVSSALGPQCTSRIVLTYMLSTYDTFRLKSNLENKLSETLDFNMHNRQMQPRLINAPLYTGHDPNAVGGNASQRVMQRRQHERTSRFTRVPHLSAASNDITAQQAHQILNGNQRTRMHSVAARNRWKALRYQARSTVLQDNVKRHSEISEKVSRGQVSRNAPVRQRRCYHDRRAFPAATRGSQCESSSNVGKVNGSFCSATKKSTAIEQVQTYKGSACVNSKQQVRSLSTAADADNYYSDTCLSSQSFLLGSETHPRNRSSEFVSSSRRRQQELVEQLYSTNNRSMSFSPVRCRHGSNALLRCKGQNRDRRTTPITSSAVRIVPMSALQEQLLARSNSEMSLTQNKRHHRCSSRLSNSSNNCNHKNEDKGRPPIMSRHNGQQQPPVKKQSESQQVSVHFPPATSQATLPRVGIYNRYVPKVNTAVAFAEKQQPKPYLKGQPAHQNRSSLDLAKSSRSSDSAFEHMPESTDWARMKASSKRRVVLPAHEPPPPIKLNQRSSADVLQEILDEVKDVKRQVHALNAERMNTPKYSNESEDDDTQHIRTLSQSSKRNRSHSHGIQKDRIHY